MPWIKRYLQTGVLLAVFLLTGCLQYDLDLQFDSQTHGQIVQHLHWPNGAIATDALPPSWLATLTERTQSVGGTLQRPADNSLKITVPFHNGKDLERRFNQFFNASAAAPLTLPGGEPIRAQLSLHQGNWIVAIYNHVELRIDLSAVPDLAAAGLPSLVRSTQLLEGTVQLTVPWGMASSVPALPAPGSWPLIAGEVTPITADFWVPSPIGIGALGIAIVTLLGYGLKYGLLQRRRP